MSSSNYFDLQQQLQSVNEQKARLEASISRHRSTAMPSSSYSPPSSYMDGYMQFSPVPRTFSQPGTRLQRSVSTAYGQQPSVPMSAAISQQSAPAMTRQGSRRSTSSTSAIPFSNNTGVLPPSLLDHQWQQSAMSSTRIEDDNNTNSLYTYGRRLPLDQVTEIDSCQIPDEYFAQHSRAPTLSITESPIETNLAGQWPPLNGQRLSVSSHRRQSFGVQSPTSSSITGLTTGTTATDMSRANSNCSDILNGSLSMLRVASNYSTSDDQTAVDNTLYQFNQTYSPEKYIPTEEQKHFVTGAIGGAPFEMALERSLSTESSSSASSTKSRAAKQLELQNKSALTRKLEPKAGSLELSSRKTTVSGSKSKLDGDDRMAIPKTPYQRPKHARVMCTLCDDVPEGFRGPHELSRHNDRRHKASVTKFICTEPADALLREIRPVVSLSSCKSCVAMKKYGIYYNAAAHLRRAHFKPKTSRGRSKSSRTENKSEKRGGKGGGDWPPMEELKHWFTKVECFGDDDLSEPEEEGGEDDFNMNDHYDEFADMTEYDSSNIAQSTPGYSEDFSYSPGLVDPSQLQNFSHHSSMSYDMQDMNNMSFPHQQTIDTSMTFSSGQAMIDYQGSLMNDSMQISMGSSSMNTNFSPTLDLSSTDLLPNQMYHHIM